MSEILKVVCEDCANSGTDWWRIYTALLNLEHGETYNMVDILDDRQFLQASDNGTSGIMNHHFTVRGGYGGHGHFQILNKQNELIGSLRVAAKSQIVTVE